VKLATFDIGTNTVLMLVVEAADGDVRPLAERCRITGLGRGLDGSGRLDPDGVRRTLDAIVEFAGEARALGVDRMVAAATAAVRDAVDGDDFIARVREEAAIELEVISGRTEAMLSYLAVVTGLAVDPSRSLLIADIGGGSTELIWAEPGRQPQLESLDIGSVRLTERIIRHDPPSETEVAETRLTIDRALEPLAKRFHPDELVGIAGTVTTVCAVAMELESYDPKLVHGHRLSRADVMGALAKFSTLALAERKRLKGMVEGRADVIFAGTTILERTMGNFGVQSVVVSDEGVRWGLLWRELERAS
jgi:exopolyphosphatase/guanosine-5'-triphosphate,3'-diphosphate pyrophosphatase